MMIVTTITPRIKHVTREIKKMKLNKEDIKNLEKEAKKIKPKQPNHLAIVKQKVINLNTTIELVKNDMELFKDKLQENKDEIVRALEWLRVHSDRLVPIEEKLDDVVNRLEAIENDRFWESIDKD